MHTFVLLLEKLNSDSTPTFFIYNAKPTLQSIGVHATEMSTSPVSVIGKDPATTNGFQTPLPSTGKPASLHPPALLRTSTSLFSALPRSGNLRKLPSLSKIPVARDPAEARQDATAPTQLLRVSASVPLLPARRPSKLEPLGQHLRHAVHGVASPVLSPSPNSRARAKIAALNKRVRQLDLSSLLDDSIGEDVESERKSCVAALREALRSNLDRVVDLFHSLDTDQSGFVDEEEFAIGVQAVCGDDLDFSQEDVNVLFGSFDLNGDGKLTYYEMHSMLKLKRPYKKELLALADPLPAWPELPRKLERFRVELLELHRVHSHLRKGSVQARMRRYSPNEERGRWLERSFKAYEESAHDRMLRSSAALSFPEFIRLYYPKRDVSGKDCEIMAKWVEEVNKVKTAHQALRALEEDAAIIEDLDTDGSGTVSMGEFLKLSKAMGVERSECRLCFRLADVERTGELSIPVMGMVLQQLRQRAAERKQEQTQTGQVLRAWCVA